MIHFMVLPWVAFTNFTHARKSDPADPVPEVAFVKFVGEGGRVPLPI